VVRGRPGAAPPPTPCRRAPLHLVTSRRSPAVDAGTVCAEWPPPTWPPPKPDRPTGAPALSSGPTTGPGRRSHGNAADRSEPSAPWRPPRPAPPGCEPGPRVDRAPSAASARARPDDGSTVGLPAALSTRSAAAVEEVAFGRGQTTGREPVCDLAGGLASHARELPSRPTGPVGEEAKHRGVAAAVVVKAAAVSRAAICRIHAPRQCERITEELGAGRLSDMGVGYPDRQPCCVNPAPTCGKERDHATAPVDGLAGRSRARRVRAAIGSGGWRGGRPGRCGGNGLALRPGSSAIRAPSA